MMKPTPQYDDRGIGPGRDFAGAGAFSQYALERMLRDCHEQPNWRMRAALCAAYYDGKQLTELQRYNIRREDLEERAINLIRPVINSVLGQEAKSRTDVKVEADDDNYADVAEVISSKLKEAERETRAHMAVSDAYASMVKKGLGWVHVSKNADPLGYNYRMESVPLDEVWWDWRGQRGPTLTDSCRWLVRQRFIDLDELEAAMPEHAAILKLSVSGWGNYLDEGGNLLGAPENIMSMEALGNETRFNMVMNKQDWVDSARKMIKCFEVWYRVPATVAVLHLSPTKRVQYNSKDPRHVEAVSRGLVKVTKGITSQVRRALYAGPHRLLDEGTTNRNFPYIPFFAFRDDEDKSPYGLIDGMVAPQDDFNERHHRIQWMLKARQFSMDDDALSETFNSLADVAEQIMRPDFALITNPNRANKTGPAVNIRNDLTMQPEQFKVQADSKQFIQDVAGRYASQMGSAQVQSGIANSMLIEQGEQSMGEMNDNYSYARRASFEQLVSEIVADHKEENIQVPVGSGKNRRVVVLNTWAPKMVDAPAVDPATGQAVAGHDGQPMMVKQPDPSGTMEPMNMVADADVVTALAETPNTPAFRQQAQAQLAQIITALGNNPQATAILAPAYIESTSITNRQQVADDLRKASGLPVPGDKEGQARAEQEQMARVAAEAQQKQQQGDAITDEKVASAERHRAAAAQALANAKLIEQRVAAGEAQANVAKTAAEIDNMQAMPPAANDDELIDQALAEASAG